MKKPKGISNKLTCVSLLNKYSKKSSIARPVYQIFTEKIQSGTHYRSQVWVDGICFKPPHTFSNKMMAKDGAARHVLIDILEKLKSDEPVGILEDTSFCKSIMNEYAVKMNTHQPIYSTESTKKLIPMFISSLELNGATYVGKPAKNKKEAEKHAARSAILSVLDSKSNITMSKIVKSKFKFYNSLKKVKDLTDFQALNNNVASGVNGDGVAEIPQPSPLVPSVQVLDVNHTGPLKSSVNRAPDTTSQDQPEFLINFFKKDKLASANAHPIELVVPLAEFAPPASGQAPSSGTEKYHKEKEGQLHQSLSSVAMISQKSPLVAMIDSGALLSVDKNNEAHGVDGSTVSEITQPGPLVPSVQVLDVNQNVLLESAVKRDAEAIAQDQPLCTHVFKKPELLQASTSTIAPSTELVIPGIEFVPPAQDPASGKKRKRKKKKRLPVSMIVSSELLSVVDKSNEARAVDGGAVTEISQPSPLVPSGQVQDLNQNGALKSDVKRAPDTTSQPQPEFSEVSVAPPTELVVPHIDVVLPASEPALKSRKKKTLKRKKGQVHQPLLPVGMTSQSPPVAMTDSGAFLSVVDRNNVAHGVDGSAVSETAKLGPSLLSGQVLDVNQNVLLESAVKRDAEAIAQDQPLCTHVFKKPELLQASTSTIAPSTELVIPGIEFVPSAQDPASGKKRKRKKKKRLPVSMIDSSELLSVVDKSNEARAVDGGAVTEISQLSPLVPSGQVQDLNQNVALKSDVKRAPDTTSQPQPEFSQVSVAPPTELVVPHIDVVLPASEPALKSRKKKNLKRKKGQVHQPLLPVDTISLSLPLDLIDNGSVLSVFDKNNEAHGVDGAVVAEIPQPGPLVPSGQVLDVNQNVLLESDMKRAPDTSAQAQPERIHVFKKPGLLQASTPAVAPLTEFMPPASEQAPASGNKTLPVDMTSQSPPVAMTDSGAFLSVVDRNNVAHGVDGSAVSETAKLGPLLLSGQVLDVNQNVLLESAVKRDAEAIAQDQPLCTHVFKKPELLQASTSTIAPSTELVIPGIEFVPPAQDPASGKRKRKKKKRLPVSMIDSSELLSVVDKSNEARAVDGGAVTEISQPSPLVPSGQVQDLNQNGALKSDVKRAADTTSQPQPEFSQVSVAPPTELVVPHIDVVLPASEPALKSRKKKNLKRKIGQVLQPLLPVDTISLSLPLDMIDNGSVLSVFDKNNEAHGVDGALVAEIPQPGPLVPSGQVLDVNQNVLLESDMKRAPDTSAQAQPERIHVFKKPGLLQASTPADAPLTEFMPPASEQAPASGNKALPVGMTSQSPPVAMTDSGAFLSVVDKKNVAHGVDGFAVSEIAKLGSMLLSCQVPDVNQNVLLESVGKQDADAASQDESECIHVFKKPELFQASTSAIAPSTELVIPPTEFVPPAQDPASRKKRNVKKKKEQLPQSPLPVSMIVSSGLLLVVDKSNESHVVDGSAVAEVSKSSPLIPSGQVPDVNQNRPLKSDVKQAPDTTSQAQPEFSQVFKKRNLKASTLAIAPPIELVVPHIDFVPPASELAPASRKKKLHKTNEGQVQQLLSSVAMISPSAPPVALIDSRSLLSVDKNNEAHSDNGSGIFEIALPGPFVPSVQVPDVNQNVLLVSAVKRDAEPTDQDQPECIHVFKNPELLQASTLAIAPSTELVTPASGKKRDHKRKKLQVPQSTLPVSMIDSSGLFSVVDKSNEAHVVDGGAVAEVLQPSPLGPSGQVPDVNQNGPLKSDVKQAPDTTSQPEFSQVLKKRKLKASTSAITPPTELVVPHIDFVPPASEPALKSRKKKNHKRKKGHVHQPPLPVDMISQSLPVAMIDSGAVLSVVDKNIEAHGVDGALVAEIPQPGPLVPSGQVPNVNQNVLLESAAKLAPDTSAQDKPERIHVFKEPDLLQASTPAVAPLTVFVPPASEQAPASGNNAFPGSIISQGPAPVAMIAQSSNPTYSVANESAAMN